MDTFPAVAEQRDILPSCFNSHKQVSFLRSVQAHLFQFRCFVGDVAIWNRPQDNAEVLASIPKLKKAIMGQTYVRQTSLRHDLQRGWQWVKC